MKKLITILAIVAFLFAGSFAYALDENLCEFLADNYPFPIVGCYDGMGGDGDGDAWGISNNNPSDNPGDNGGGCKKGGKRGHGYGDKNHDHKGPKGKGPKGGFKGPKGGPHTN